MIEIQRLWLEATLVRLAGPIYSAAAWDAACHLDWTSRSKQEGFETLKEGPVQ
jgi:hypothetical protein